MESFQTSSKDVRHNSIAPRSVVAWRSTTSPLAAKIRKITGSSWRQLSIQFDAWKAAEHTGVTYLGPILTAAEAAGLVASWFFIRKAPCWRLRFLPSDDSTAYEATAFIHRRLSTLRDADSIGPWVETIY